MSKKRRTYGRNIGNIGMTFTGKTNEEKNKQVNDFVQSCIEQCNNTAIDFDSMLTKKLVTIDDDKTIYCNQCSHKTSRKDHMLQHIAHHYEEFCYTCKFCGTKCTTQAHFKVHLKKHTGVPEFHCDQCSFSTFIKGSLQRHKEQTHNTNIRYQCQACTQKFSSFDDKLNHTKTCQSILGGSKPGWVKCQVNCACKFECQEMKTMIGHVKNEHGYKALSCPICPSVFSDAMTLKEHTRLHKNYACCICTFVTERKIVFLKHMFQLHSANGVTHRCPMCGETKPSKVELERHRSQHRVIDPREVSGTTTEISKAIRYKCLLCDYVTPPNAAFSLKKHHRRMHTTQKSFSCAQCPYKCKERAQLTLHERKHAPARLYLCQECGFSCKWPSQIRMHRLRHAGKKLHKCPKCPYESFRPEGVTLHMRNKHPVPREFPRVTPREPDDHQSRANVDFEKCEASLKTQESPQSNTTAEPSSVTSCTDKTPSSDHETRELEHLDLDQPTVCLATDIDRCLDRLLDNDEGEPVPRFDANSPESFEQFVSENPVTEEERPPTENDKVENDQTASDGKQSVPSALACFFCAHVASSNNSLYLHIRKEHRQQSYSCDLCRFTTGKISQFIVHRQSHNGIVLPCCPEKNCNYIACTAYQLRLHALKHVTTHKFKCSKCPFAARWRNQLRLHVMKAHAVRKMHRCPHCDYSCYRSDVMRSHVSQRHSDDRPHKCATCGFAAKVERSLRIHMVSHRTERPHTCETCGKSFKSRQVLVNHERSHARVPAHSCPFCKFRCDETTNFENHHRRHLREFAALPFRCPLCPYAAKSVRTLGAHKRRRHPGIKVLQSNETVQQSKVPVAQTTSSYPLPTTNTSDPLVEAFEAASYLPSLPSVEALSQAPLSSLVDNQLDATGQQQSFCAMLLSDNNEFDITMPLAASHDLFMGPDGVTDFPDEVFSGVCTPNVSPYEYRQ